MFRTLVRLVNPVAYWLYVLIAKLRQLPTVLADNDPLFESDEIIRPSVGTIYALVVKYSKFGLEDGVPELTAALRAQGINVVTICNGTPSSETLQQLRLSSHRVLIRKNVGRDFGAYRAGTLLLLKEKIVQSRLLYFNDSVVYLKGPELSELVNALATSSADLQGAHENHENSHHIGSFAFSVSPAVLADPQVVRFWRRYQPFDLRPHAINQGEVRLSRVIKAAGYKVDALYSAQKLASRLNEMALADLIGLLRYLPSRSRHPQPASLLSIPNQTAMTLRRIRWNDTPGTVTTPRIGEFKLTQSVRRASAIDERLRDSQLVKDSMIDQLMASFLFNSQVHYGFGLYHRVMKSPLVKKDLILRGVYLEHECMRVLDDLPSETANVIVRLLVNRGRPLRTSTLDSFKYYNGLL